MKGSTDVSASAVTLRSDLQAFLAVPPGPGPHPCVILLHERYGLVQHTRDLARRFASEGYLCLAPDLFSDMPAVERERLNRGEIRKTLPDPQAAQYLGITTDWLRRHTDLEVAEIAIMGVCQTGRYAFVGAAQRPEVSAIVVFYGAVQEDEWAVNETRPESLEAIIAKCSAPVLGIFGELDHIISVEDVERLCTTLKRHRKSYHIEIFPRAPHGWLNDTMPGRYRREQAEAAWTLLHRFLRDVRSDAYPSDRVRWTFTGNVSVTYDFSQNKRLE